jgi:hypothetical protein
MSFRLLLFHLNLTYSTLLLTIDPIGKLSLEWNGKFRT